MSVFVAELVSRFIDIAVSLVRAKRHCAPYLAALGLLLNRAPLYGGPETVVSPDLVEHAYSAFQGFDWTEPELLELQTLFLRAARVVGDRSLDLPIPLRGLIAGKMEKSGVPPLRTAKIRDHPGRTVRPGQPVRRFTAPGPGPGERRRRLAQPDISAHEVQS